MLFVPASASHACYQCVQVHVLPQRLQLFRILSRGSRPTLPTLLWIWSRKPQIYLESSDSLTSHLILYQAARACNHSRHLSRLRRAPRQALDSMLPPMSRLQYNQISELQDPTQSRRTPSPKPAPTPRACAYVPSQKAPQRSSTKLHFARTWPGILVEFRDSSIDFGGAPCYVRIVFDTTATTLRDKSSKAIRVGITTTAVTMLANLETDRARAAALEAQILDLEHALSALRIEKAPVQERLDSYKYPVLTLPNGIVSEIFVHFLLAYHHCGEKSRQIFSYASVGDVGPLRFPLSLYGERCPVLWPKHNLTWQRLGFADPATALFRSEWTKNQPSTTW
ncbi:hypothetical protein B0H19DRAFT_1077284 [Mycena capillaripes]|nr:hypothetical protein B0H19DRAFT_1077284 [Mycena capillaripes]